MEVFYIFLKVLVERICQTKHQEILSLDKIMVIIFFILMACTFDEVVIL